MAQLTDTQISNAKPADKPYRLADGGALFLEIGSNGVKLWRYRYRLAGKQNIYAIGRYFDSKKKPPRSHFARNGQGRARPSSQAGQARD